jgi:hypothetical protein
MIDAAYYTNVYYKYTHGSFNIDNDFFIILKWYYITLVL